MIPRSPRQICRRIVTAAVLVAVAVPVSAASSGADPDVTPIEPTTPSGSVRAAAFDQVYVSAGLDGSGSDYSFVYPGNSTDVVTGDWNGDGQTGFASRSANVFTLLDEKGYFSGTAAYGQATDRLVIGDWDGNRSDTFGVRRGNQYFLRNHASTGVADIVLAYGQATDELFVGDWNGDGTDTFAVRRGNIFFVRNSITTGVADTVFAYGRAGDETYVGDWNGDGTDTFAVRRGNEFFIRNDFRTGVAQLTFQLGLASDRVVVGDFDGDGDDTFALLRNVDGAVPAERNVVAQGYTPFGSAGGVVFVHPSTQVELIGFHQGAHPGSQELSVAATAVANTNLPSRGRGTGLRSAADIVVEPHRTIRSPVSGTVRVSGTYALYCQFSDDFLYIAPDAQPTWEVRIYHIDGVQVQAGDRVEAGITVIAPQPTQLPFDSQVDDYTAEPSWPHVHVELIDLSIPANGNGGC